MTEEDALRLAKIKVQKTELKMKMEALEMAEAVILRKAVNILPGDRVRTTSGRMQGVEFVVHQVHPMASIGSGGKPWVSCYQIRKDGTRGMILKHLYYEWEKVENGISTECGQVER